METSSDRKSGGTPMFTFLETTCRKSKYMILLLDMDRCQTILMSFQEVHISFIFVVILAFDSQTEMSVVYVFILYKVSDVQEIQIDFYRFYAT